MNDNKPDGITLNHRFYSTNQLLNWTIEEAKDHLTANEIDTLTFCRQWLSGQSVFVVHTSGSTGKPKAITITREQMIISAQGTGKAVGLQAGDRMLVCMPTRYIAGKMMLVRAFVLSMHIVIIEPSSHPLAGFNEQEHFDFTALVPLQLQTILDGQNRYKTILNRMKAVLVGGGAVSASLQQRLQSVRAAIYHTYGMTETVTHIALRRLNGKVQSDAFFPLNGVQLALDERDCLTIQAPVTRNERLHTNDLVELRPNGSFIWLGRIDNVINSGGVKIQVEKVEQAIEHMLLERKELSLSTRRFFVSPQPHEHLGQIVTLIIEGHSLADNTEMMIRSELEKLLDKYEVPRQIHYVAHFKETPTNKIDRLATLHELRN